MARRNRQRLDRPQIVTRERTIDDEPRNGPNWRVAPSGVGASAAHLFYLGYAVCKDPVDVVGTIPAADDANRCEDCQAVVDEAEEDEDDEAES